MFSIYDWELYEAEFTIFLDASLDLGLAFGEERLHGGINYIFLFIKKRPEGVILECLSEMKGCGMEHINFSLMSGLLYSYW